MKVTVTSFFAALCLCCAVNVHLFAQPEDIISRTYTMKEGLSNEFVESLLQDSQGFLWVGTQGGLNKFDGYHFTTYRVNPSDSNSLTNNYISCLWEDKQQRLWIGTSTGLDLLDLKTEKFHHLPLDSSYKSDVGVGNIRERKDGMVWLCTGQGIYLADPQTLSITRIIHFPQNVDEKNFMDIAEARDGSVWAAGASGLVHVDASTGQTTRYRHDPGDPHSLVDDVAWMVHVDRHDRVWVGTDYGLDLFNPEDQSFTHFLPGGLQFVGSQLRVNDLLENPDGTFWVGTSRGLYDFDPETGKFNLLTIDPIWSVIKDRRGSIWYGSGYGLYQIAPQSKKFTIYRQFGQKDVSDITSLAEDANQHIWIAVFKPNYQLFRYDPSSGSFIEYRHDPENPHSYSGKPIWSFIPDDEGGVWMATQGNLEKFNPKNQTFSSIVLPEPTTIFKDSQGMLWVGHWVGAGKYDPQTETYEPLADFPRTRVNSILEDREENIWLGTQSGLFRYSLQTRHLDVFKNHPANPQSLSSNRVYHLMMDQEGTIWVGTDGGLNKMIPGPEKEEPTFMHWQTTTSNLPHDDVYCIVDGGDGTLWMSCGNRISHFFPQPGEFRNYDQHDGLHGKRVGANHAKGLRSQKGEIYFGSMDGLIVFHPDSLQDNPYIPPVVITGFSIDNQPLPIQGSYGDTLQGETPLAHAIPYTDEVELTYQQRDFSLEFAALNFINPENNLYKYRLEPYEKEWIEASASNRIARYTNLSPGRYTFRVIGSNNDGLWNEEGRNLSIIIHPPWWQTWWAYALYVLLALWALWIIRHYEIKRLKLRQKAAHLSELDAFKSRFYTNITHEFRTPLTVILGVTDEIDQQYQKIKSVIKRNGLNLLQLVNQMLDLSKLEAGMLTINLQQGDIIPYIRYIVESFHSLAENKYIHIHFRSEVPELIMDYDAGKVLNIVSNLLSNAIKFTPEGGHVSLVVSGRRCGQIQENHASRFHLRITDTGMGIPADQLPHIFDRFYQVDASTTRKGGGTGIGLSLTQELIKLLGGTIAVKSTVWQGTEFTVELPITNTAPIAEETTQPVFETAGDHGDDLNEGLPPTGERHSQPVALIVEDNVDVVYYLRTCLQDNYTLEVAQNGQDGITKALERMPDIIISDIMMPEKNGYELCETLKNNVKTSHIPIILLTAKAGEEDKIEGLEVGADAYLTKPFNKQELKVQIRNLITQRRKLWSQYNESFAYRPQELEVSAHDQKFLTKALKVLEDHKSDPDFSAESLQKELGVSRTLLHVKLKALTGQSTTEFIRTYRLKYAAQLIRQHFGNVAQVAYEAGFNDQSYFTKSFRKHFGIAPSEYAKSATV